MLSRVGSNANYFFCAQFTQTLLQVFIKYGQTEDILRMNLIAEPLNWSEGILVANHSVLVTKFNVWWLAICNFQCGLNGFHRLLLIPFLKFCFGPIAQCAAIQWTKPSDSFAAVER